MLTRLTLLIAAFSAMGAGGFTLGRSSASACQAGGIDVPQEHPVVIALEKKAELMLSPAQTARLEEIKAALANQLAPYQRKAKDLESRARQLQESGGTPEAKARLESDIKALQQSLESQVPLMMAKATEEVIQTLDQDQRESLQRLMQARMAKSGSHDLVLTFIMEKREQLGISPQQFTKLQYLQADLIRAFAPIREQMELLQIEVRNTQTEPPAEMVQKMKSLEDQVGKLKHRFSNRAIEEVLDPEQRQKLQQLLREGGR